MGGIACEAKAIRDYGILNAEADGLSTFATGLGFHELAASAKTLSRWAYAGWLTALKLLSDPALDDASRGRIVRGSYAICQWATEMRGWRQALAAWAEQHHAKGAEPYAYEQWVLTMHGWIDLDMATLGEIAEAGIDPEYQPVTS